MFLKTNVVYFRLQLCPADLTLSLLRSALSGIQWSSLTPCLLRDLTQLTAYIFSSCSSSESLIALYIMVVQDNLVIGNLQLALQVFRSYSLLHDLLLSVCISEEEQALWPWTARLGEQGLQLEINLPLLQLSLALLQPHPRRRQGEKVQSVPNGPHLNTLQGFPTSLWWWISCSPVAISALLTELQWR